MGKVRLQCPCCGSWTLGEKVRSKVGRFAAKKGATTATGAVIGSIVPGVGTLLGAAIGAGIGYLTSSGVDKLMDEFDDDYKFVCPNPSCGHEWTKNVSELDSVSSNNSFSSSNHSVRSSNIIDKQRIYKFLAERGYNYATVLSIDASGVRLKVRSQTRLGEDYIKGEADGSFFEGQMFMA